jgi:hypothetical protein
MVESLTGMMCVPKNAGEHYFFEANYAKHHDPDYINGIWLAIEGRAGKRLISIEDLPERETLYVRVNFSEENTATSVVREMPGGHPETGNAYCKRLEQIRAVQVERGNIDQLIQFVGNGEMEIERKPGGKATFHFRNAAGSVFCHADEHDYIIFVRDGLYGVIKKAEFEKEYEPK